MSDALGEDYTALLNLKPGVKDIAKLWKIDIGEALQSYTNTFVDDINEPNFSKAALLIRNASNLYSRKVDTLYDETKQVIFRISKQSATAKQRGPRNCRPDDPFADDESDDDPDCTRWYEDVDIIKQPKRLNLDVGKGKYRDCEFDECCLSGNVPAIPRMPAALQPIASSNRRNLKIWDKQGEAIGLIDDYVMATALASLSGVLLVDYNEDILNKARLTTDSTNTDRLAQAVDTEFPACGTLALDILNEPDALVNDVAGDCEDTDADFGADNNTSRPILDEQAQKNNLRGSDSEARDHSEHREALCAMENRPTENNKYFGAKDFIKSFWTREDLFERCSQGNERFVVVGKRSIFKKKKQNANKENIDRCSLLMSYCKETFGETQVGLKVAGHEVHLSRKIEIERSHRLSVIRKRKRQMNSLRKEQLNASMAGGAFLELPMIDDDRLGEEQVEMDMSEISSVDVGMRSLHHRKDHTENRQPSPSNDTEIDWIPFSRDFVQLLKDAVDGFYVGSAEMDNMRISDVGRRVREWILQVVSNIEKEEKDHGSFDIHEIGTQLLARVPQGNPPPPVTITFRDLVQGEEPYMAARMFTALLQLVNSGNIQLVLPDSQQCEMNTVSLRVLTWDRQDI